MKWRPSSSVRSIWELVKLKAERRNERVFKLAYSTALTDRDYYSLWSRAHCWVFSPDAHWSKWSLPLAIYPLAPPHLCRRQGKASNVNSKGNIYRNIIEITPHLINVHFIPLHLPSTLFRSHWVDSLPHLAASVATNWTRAAPRLSAAPHSAAGRARGENALRYSPKSRLQNRPVSFCCSSPPAKQKGVEGRKVGGGMG